MRNYRIYKQWVSHGLILTMDEFKPYEKFIKIKNDNLYFKGIFSYKFLWLVKFYDIKCVDDSESNYRFTHIIHPNNEDDEGIILLLDKNEKLFIMDNYDFEQYISNNNLW